MTPLILALTIESAISLAFPADIFSFSIFSFTVGSLTMYSSGNLASSTVLTSSKPAALIVLRYSPFYAAPAMQPFVRDETLPGAQVQSDDELLDYARRNGGTCYHASCTCMMGPHAMAVVDDELRVHGLEGLRVIDASVMPAVSSTNTNAPTIMIAEKGAAIIKGAARQKLAA